MWNHDIHGMGKLITEGIRASRLPSVRSGLEAEELLRLPAQGTDNTATSLFHKIVRHPYTYFFKFLFEGIINVSVSLLHINMLNVK